LFSPSSDAVKIKKWQNYLDLILKLDEMEIERLRNGLASIASIDVAVSSLNYQVRHLLRKISKQEHADKLDCSALVFAMVRTAVNFQKALTLSRYASQIELKRHLSEILPIDKDCLSKFIGLVQKHFDLTKANSSDEQAPSKITIYDMFEMIKTTGTSHIGFKKNLLTQLEA